MKTFLKIKIKNLGDEAADIKREEAKWKKAPWKPSSLEALSNARVTHPMFFKLQEHRLHVVRTECRSANIAYGYMRGRSYHEIENKCHEAPNWARVEAIIAKFSGSKYIAVADRKQLYEDLKVWASPPSEEVEVEEVEDYPIIEAVLDRIGAFIFG